MHSLPRAPFSLPVSLAVCLFHCFPYHSIACIHVSSLTRKLATASFCCSFLEMFLWPNWSLTDLVHLQINLICILLSKQNALNYVHPTKVYLWASVTKVSSGVTPIIRTPKIIYFPKLIPKPQFPIFLHWPYTSPWFISEEMILRLPIQSRG